MNQSDSQPAVQDHAEVGGGSPAPLHLLHIEDNSSDAQLMQEHLHATVPSVDFDSAERLADVTAARATAADCALLDLSLPDATGLDALLALRRMSDRLPIIVLTGFDDLELGLAAVRQGADDYLVKNHADGYTLERAVRYAIERRSLLLRLDATFGPTRRPVETVAADASPLTAGAVMTAALQLIRQTLANSEPTPSRTHPSPAGAQLDQRSRALELELQGESGDWVDHEPTPAGDGETSATTAALVELRLIVLDDQRRNATLLRILQLAKRAIPDLVDASITVYEKDQAKTIVFTGPLAVELDERQFDIGSGPCTDAALTVDAVVVATDEENPYPHISLAARRAGVTHIISHALPVAEGFVGALNLYIASTRPVEADTVLLAESFASCAAVVVADAASHRDAAERATQMQQALKTRGSIEMAKGLLMARNHCSSTEAFETLARRSQNASRAIGDIAATLVAEAGDSQP